MCLLGRLDFISDIHNIRGVFCCYSVRSRNGGGRAIQLINQVNARDEYKHSIRIPRETFMIALILDNICAVREARMIIYYSFYLSLVCNNIHNIQIIDLNLIFINSNPETRTCRRRRMKNIAPYI